MKYINKSIYAFALVGMMGLWSCSQEDVLQGGDVTASGHSVPVTLTVNRSDAQTRTVLSENTATGGLNSDWRTTDKLNVMVKGKGIVGTLDFVEFPDESQKGTAVFAGNLTLEDGVQNALVYYCDDAVAEINDSKTQVRVSLKNQKFHSVEELSAMDMLYEHINLNIKGNVANVTQNEYMKAHLAMAHFDLELPDGTEGTLYISDCGAGRPIYHTALINTYDDSVNMGFEKSANENTELAAEVKADHQVYMALPAQYSGGKYHDVTLSFRFVADNGDVYTYAFENPTRIEAGLYYNSFDQANGTMSGFNIPLVKEQIPELRLNANFTDASVSEIVVIGEGTTYDLTKTYLSNVDKETQKTLSVRNDGYTFVGWSKDPTGNGSFEESASLTESATYYAIWAKNPLYKWAEGDLVYNKNTGKSTVASSYTTQGSLYQWGRNVGWKDYRDAMGGMYNNTKYLYLTYKTSYKTGTGMYGGVDHSSFYYDAKSDLAESKEFYFMNPEGTDYWVSSFGEGGSTWADRAKKCGWSESIAPNGYRMPTLEDYLEIKPSDPISGSGTLASLLDISEIKDYKGNDNLKVVWHWTSFKSGARHYLKIYAKVVSKYFESSDISRINWNDQVSVVTKCFGANGFIHGFKHVNIVSQYTFPVARPMPGTEVHGDKLSVGTSAWTVLWNYITDLSVNNEGYYWMSDEKTAFTFQDNAAAKAQQCLYPDTGEPNGTYAFPDKISLFGTLPINAQDCASIRCIDVNREKN